MRESENRLKLSLPFGAVLVFYHAVICEGCGSNKAKTRISCLIFKNKVLVAWPDLGASPIGCSDALCSHCRLVRGGEYW